jgi:LuxR family transcriptional regulator, quorum-sensing system regulator BjaR1
MMTSSQRNLVCDTITDINSLTSLPQVGPKFATAVANLGFSALGINILPLPREDADPVILTEIVPNGFRDLYIHERFYAVDHLVANARVACEPFRFSDVPFAPGETQRQRRFLQALEAFNMGQGIVVPIGRTANTPACAWLAGKKPELHADAILATQMISLFAASKAQVLSRSGQPFEGSSTLTPREREVLQWIAAGKSAWEVGQILGIAKRTVDEHVHTASRKLNASNRTQAVVIALRDKLIAF